ncbi:MAG: VanZ family protein [Chloroflexi bacterium]|nr:VanZ family protein [Chloroflexota bacterium]
MKRSVVLLWHWLPVLLWMAMILSLSGQSELPVRHNPQTGEVIKTTYTVAKLAHVVEYSVLALVLLRALTASGGGIGLSTALAICWTVMLAFSFGALDEYRQAFTPTREPRAVDVLIDGLSALAASLIFARWRRVRRPAGVPTSLERVGS